LASLDNPHNIKSVRFFDLLSANQVLAVWCLVLASESDTFTVPGLESTSAVGSLTSGISVSAGALNEGSNLITVSGGSAGGRVLVATAHRKGFTNNLSLA